MLKVLTPALSQNLTTYGHLVEMLPDAIETAQGTAERLIAQASRAAADWCRRPFALEKVRESHYVAGCAGFALERTPVVNIESVWFDNALVDPSGYRWDEARNEFWRRNPITGQDEGWPHGELHIVYAGGYVLPDAGTAEAPSTLPESVELACVLMVAAYRAMLGRDPTIRSETIEGVGSTSWLPSPTAIPDAEAARLLAPYRRLF